jgi:hypothetical protein
VLYCLTPFWSPVFLCFLGSVFLCSRCSGCAYMRSFAPRQGLHQNEEIKCMAGASFGLRPDLSGQLKPLGLGSMLELSCSRCFHLRTPTQIQVVTGYDDQKLRSLVNLHCSTLLQHLAFDSRAGTPPDAQGDVKFLQVPSIDFTRKRCCGGFSLGGGDCSDCCPCRCGRRTAAVVRKRCHCW